MAKKFSFLEVKNCPFCNSNNFVKDGISAGKQRYWCKSCNKVFTSTTGTMLSNTKKSETTWRNYVLYLTNDATIKAASEYGSVNKNTAYLWRRKFFACIHKYQEKVLLSGVVWFDEIFFSVSGKDIIFTNKGHLLKGISRNKIAVEVGIDMNGNCYCHVIGKGKPTSIMVKESLISHIEKGAALIHDEFHGHASLVNSVGGKDIVSNTKNKDLKTMQKINQFCALIKRIITLHAGERRENLQYYLDWICFRTKVYHMPTKERKKSIIAVCCNTKANHKRKVNSSHKL